MTIGDLTNIYPNAHVRVIRYCPAPDIMNEHGDLVCGGEGESTIVFDSTTGDGDMPFDLFDEEATTYNMDSEYDGCPVLEIEYIPDEYWY